MEKLWDLHTVAATCGITYHQACALARGGVLPVVKIGRKYRVDPETFREWVRAGGQSFEGGWRKEVAKVN